MRCLHIAQKQFWPGRSQLPSQKRPNGESFDKHQVNDTMGSAEDQILPSPRGSRRINRRTKHDQATCQRSLDLSPLQNGERPPPGRP